MTSQPLQRINTKGFLILDEEKAWALRSKAGGAGQARKTDGHAQQTGSLQAEMINTVIGNEK